MDICISYHAISILGSDYMLLMIDHFLFLSAIYNGYPTFVVSICAIGACTAVIGDVAGHLGCFINLKDSVNAIAFVALGTSVPGIMNRRLHAFRCS